LVSLPKFRYPDGDLLVPDTLAVLLPVPGAVLLNVVSNSTHEKFLFWIIPYATQIIDAHRPWILS